MRIILLSLIALFVIDSAKAQFVIINTPEDCAGTLRFGTASGWGRLVTDSIWTEDVVIVNDGTALPTEGCSPLVNGTDVAGKIALIRRGSCNFSLKALNAQTSGAIAVVIDNHTAGAGVINMGAGTFGANITIPVVMVSFEDGEMIREKLETGTVNMTIGNVQFDYDLSVQRESVNYPGYGTMPISQVQQVGDFVFTPGAAVFNNGLKHATNVTVEATVSHTPPSGSATEIYNETGAINLIEIDSTRRASLTDLDVFATGMGRYDFEYTIAGDSADQATGDNVHTAAFTVSANKFSKAGWDAANDRPFRTTGYTIAGGGSIEMLSSFEFTHGLGNQINSVQYNVSTSNPSLAGIAITVYVYKWVDANSDGIFESDEVELVALGIEEFDASETATDAWVNTPISDLITGDDGYIVPEDDAIIVVGTRYEGQDLVFFGFDENIDLNEYINTVTTDKMNYNEAKLPYLQTTTFGNSGADFGSLGLFTDLWGVLATTLVLGPITSVNELSDDQIEISLYPNPAHEVLTVELELTDKTNNMIDYQIMDNLGRVIYHSERAGVYQDVFKYDVSQLNSGNYELMITADEGFISKRFIVK